MLQDKVIVVTGGAGLLGRTFCKALAQNGATAIVADIQIDKAQEVATDLNTLPGRTDAVQIDITNSQSIDDAIATLHQKYQRIDGVVNNAYPRNSRWGCKLEDTTYEDFCENVGMHLGGYFMIMKKFSEYFSKQNGGRVVNMSSIYGVMLPRNSIYAGTNMSMSAEYAAIKSSIVHLTKFFAQHFRDKNINVNCISPGGILDKQPESFLKAYRSFCGKKGMLNPDDISGTLVYLFSNASEYVTGQNIIVDDGFSL